MGSERLRVLVQSLGSVFALIFCGCAYQQNLDKFNALYYENDQKQAYEFSKSLAENDLLWEIQNGVVGWSIGEYEKSHIMLNKAEIVFNKNHEEGIFSTTGANLGATLINDNIKSYRGNIYEGVLINYYKALDNLALGNKQKARVEFNRANDRQRRAKDYYQKEIQRAIEEQHEKTKEKGGKASSVATEVTSKTQIDHILNTQYSNLKKYGAYDGFINPLVSYVSGLYFSLQGDPKGIDLLKEAYGINNSKFIGEDILAFQNGETTQKYTWIIIEDGKSPSKKEFSLTLPFDGYIFSFALPQLIDGVSFYNSFTLKSNEDVKNLAFEEISLFDGVIANEFSKQLPYIVTRAIISSVYKVVLQAVLNDNLGSIAGLTAAIFSVVTNSADTRITSIFPHKTWLNRSPNDIGKITLFGDDKKLYEFEISDDCLSNFEETNKLCKNTNNLVYIRTTKNSIITQLIIGDK